MKDAYCSFCGAAFLNTTSYPKRCDACHKETYLNAVAVGIALVPINRGLLHIKRAIKPNIGGIALPGGHKNVDETWEECVERETLEETGIVAKVKVLAGVHTAANGAVLVFGLCEHLIIPEPIPYVLDHETADAFVLNSFEELCFPHHTNMSKWFWHYAKDIFDHPGFYPNAQQYGFDRLASDLTLGSRN